MDGITNLLPATRPGRGDLPQLGTAFLQVAATVCRGQQPRRRCKHLPRRWRNVHGRTLLTIRVGWQAPCPADLADWWRSVQVSVEPRGTR
jgi:hypothetical protein